MATYYNQLVMSVRFISQENKRMLIWFLIGVLIALLPWLALA